MNRIDTNGKNAFNVGDEAYIIESNRSVRKVTIIKISRDFCTASQTENLSRSFVM